jgi:hypothetical protein
MNLGYTSRRLAKTPPIAFLLFKLEYFSQEAILLVAGPLIYSFQAMLNQIGIKGDRHVKALWKLVEF